MSQRRTNLQQPPVRIVASSGKLIGLHVSASEKKRAQAALAIAFQRSRRPTPSVTPQRLRATQHAAPAAAEPLAKAVALLLQPRRSRPMKPKIRRRLPRQQRRGPHRQRQLQHR